MTSPRNDYQINHMSTGNSRRSQLFLVLSVTVVKGKNNRQENGHYAYSWRLIQIGTGVCPLSVPFFTMRARAPSVNLRAQTLSFGTSRSRLSSVTGDTTTAVLPSIAKEARTQRQRSQFAWIFTIFQKYLQVVGEFLWVWRIVRICLELLDAFALNRLHSDAFR